MKLSIEIETLPDGGVLAEIYARDEKPITISGSGGGGGGVSGSGGALHLIPTESASFTRKPLEKVYDNTLHGFIPKFRSALTRIMGGPTE